MWLRLQHTTSIVSAGRGKLFRHDGRPTRAQALSVSADSAPLPPSMPNHDCTVVVADLSFTDLGSGEGLPCITAAASGLFHTVLGIELVEVRGSTPLLPPKGHPCICVAPALVYLSGFAAAPLRMLAVRYCWLHIALHPAPPLVP